MIFISAAIEGLLLLGWYYPGSLVIFLGVILAGDDVPRVLEVVATVIVGLLTAYVLNFFIGKHGWYRLLLKLGVEKPLKDAEARLSKYGPQAIFLTYFHPNLAALTATAAGILQIPFRTFFIYSVVAVIAWDSFWGLVVFIFGKASLALMGLPVVLSVVIVWICYRLWTLRKEKITDVVEQ